MSKGWLWRVEPSSWVLQNQAIFGYVQPVSPLKLLVIVSIAAGHVMAAGWDQFVTNVLLYEGFLHQILRDLGFMGPDLLNIWLPIQELQIYAKRRKAPASYLITNKLAMGALGTSFSIWFISAIIL